MTTTEKLRAIQENLALAISLSEIIEQKQAAGRVTMPLSMTVLTMLEIQTKNAADILAEMNRNIA